MISPQRLKDIRSYKRFFSYLKVGRKRFYKSADIEKTKDGYLIQLDKKTIKTPLLNQLCIPSRPLAFGVAQEWNSQMSEIKPHAMPLTSICNTAIDNPTGMKKYELINALLEFLHTDTICAISDAPEALVEYQDEHWTPIRDWFANKYDVEVTASANLFTMQQPQETIVTMETHLGRLNQWQLYGLQAAVDSTKSFILPLAFLHDRINADNAIFLSHLEQEFQIERWGRFEGSHDIDRYDKMTHLTAAYLVYHMSNDIG